ncbi:hypothetical protein [Halogeometricum luteum]|uniref:Uncharacterized protein n=1 Tax=Halogeometricum luteum TaxID=2950537 RepID=A0ABU2FY24_9EURY|nr:hypothetical protein [Halogeometricum sp. S3BR5-2]MDS0292838.1 hypothetical protein [Halogeometricum sp. S3BR5-2]
MSIREWAAFGIDLAHILLLSVVYVVGLTAMTANARVRRACLDIRTSADWRSNGRPN